MDNDCINVFRLHWVKMSTVTGPSSTKKFWETLDCNLSLIQFEFEEDFALDKKTETLTNIGVVSKGLNDFDVTIAPPTADRRSWKKLTRRNRNKENVSVGKAIPTLKASEKSIDKSPGGVNHLNLIQIKGNPAHAWQPWMSHENQGIIKPDISTVEVNNILLNPAKEKRKNTEKSRKSKIMI